VAQGNPAYGERLAQVEAFLAAKRAIVFATSEGARVTARTVSFASSGVEVYFMSFAANTKCRQIRANPHVALCRDNVQIEGTAQILGPVTDSSNAAYAGLLRDKYPEDYAANAAHPEMILLRVVPSRIGVYRKDGDQHLVDRLDLKSMTLTVERLAETGP
jgi:general stress protein 26